MEDKPACFFVAGPPESHKGMVVKSVCMHALERRGIKWVPKKGRILEVGVGTGKNLPYPENQEIFAIDISENMLQRAKSRAEKQRTLIHLAQMDVERLAFPDKIFDAAISTYVFCSQRSARPLLRHGGSHMKEDEITMKKSSLLGFNIHACF